MNGSNIQYSYKYTLTDSLCVCVFPGPTNAEDPVQLLMKDAGKSKPSSSLVASSTNHLSFQDLDSNISNYAEITIISSIQNVKVFRFAFLLPFCDLNPKQLQQMQRYIETYYRFEYRELHNVKR